jgi:hypothetical protein
MRNRRVLENGFLVTRRLSKARVESDRFEALRLEVTLQRLEHFAREARSAVLVCRQDRRNADGLREVQRFFQDYKALEHKQVIVEDMLGPSEAIAIINDALALYRRLRRGELGK